MPTMIKPTTESQPEAGARRVFMASFGALTMLIVQSVLGTAYGLFGTAPSAGKPVGMFSSPLLDAHVIMGMLILLSGIMLVVRAIQLKAVPVLVTSVVGLLAVLGAFGAGTSFIGNGGAGTSFYMALTSAVAMLCYGANLMVLGGKRS